MRARSALDIALPTLCVSCREPVDGEGVCAECWAKLSFIAPPYLPAARHSLCLRSGPELLSMEAIANPPAYRRARAAVRYDDVARTLVHCAEISGPHRSRARDGPLDGARGRRTARRGRRAGPGAAALAARLEPPLQPVRRAGAGDLAPNRRQTGLRGAAAHAATQQQIGLSRPQRASNVQGAFKVAAERSVDIQGRRVILIDDVLTRARRWMPARVRCCAPGPRRSTMRIFARVVDTHRAPI